MKEKLGVEATTALEIIQEGITWLDAHQEDEKETYADYQKSVEEKVRPVMMKLYADEAQGAPDASKVPEASKGPKIEEVD